jgi:sensor histidine kinase regulating citrate/malate metabolism
MEYSKMISISGMPGLYELVGSKKDGAIVRSLDDKSTKFVSSRIHNFSHLESIEVYTVRDNVNLVEILAAIDAAGEELPSEKDNAAIKAYFQKVYPDMDFERVYASDMKKMIKWYSVLKANNVELKLSEEAEEEIEAEEDVVAPEEAEIKQNS